MEQALRIATWIAAALLAAGLALWLIGAPAAPLVLHAGLWLLISTPIVRVLMALVEYLAARDWAFVALTLIVLACLVVPLSVYFLSLAT
ncbi:MAG: DUF1634 domain-containing protein [Vicinamibacterales bacterium]